MLKSKVFAKSCRRVRVRVYWLSKEIKYQSGQHTNIDWAILSYVRFETVPEIINLVVFNFSVIATFRLVILF